VSLTIADLLLARAGDHHVGLRFEDKTWTWAEVVDASRVRAAVLSMICDEAPRHVGVLLDNVPEYVFLLGGAALAGVTVVGINPTRRGEELAVDIRHTDCRLIVTDDEHAALLDGLDLGMANGQVVRVGSERWHGLLESAREDPPPSTPPGPETLFVLIFTSGSTGAPKAVRATQARFAGLAQAMGFTPDDVLYCPMPLFHGNALVSNLLPGIAAGATVALRRRFSASGFLPDVRHYGATFTNTVGRALSYVLATPPSSADRDHHLRFVLAPESSAADMAAFTERFGCPVIDGYGSSEGAIKMAPARRGRPGELGEPLEGADVAVIDPATMHECPRALFDDVGRLLNASEAIGEIVRRDPRATFEGYYNNPEADAERMRNGWFWSGDLAYRDGEGVFWFAGRSHDWLRVDGENFAAAPVERILMRHPDVGAAAVYAVPDAVTGDQVMAAVELGPGRAFDPEGFAAFLTAQADLGTKWAPRFVRVMRSLPVTGTNKVDRRQLRADAWQTDDDVWWRPVRDPDFRRMTASDVESLRTSFAAHGRDRLLPP
jgi:fatty-acyl-CoA synthase